MRKILFLTFVLTTILSNAQVGINTQDPKATLDIQKGALTTSVDGLITTRLTGNELKNKDSYYGTDQNSTVVYVTALPSPTTTKTSNITTTGFYYYNSSLSKWMALNLPKFFYMPSIYFDTTTLGTFTKDLYQLYYDQFNTPAIKSTNSLGKVPVIGRSDLEYYITSLDTTVFTSVTINDSGVMTYTISNNASDISFLNIVFVVK